MSLTGVLLVDKAVGPTSHDVVGKIRKASGIRKVGHAGTLDPFASGLLLVMVGSATRLSEYFLGMDKCYEATVHLGVETVTHDREGEVVSENPDWARVGTEALKTALEKLTGTISQLPPVYSAKKVQGESAHRRARRGEVVELAPVEVLIQRLELLEIELPMVRLHVSCSSGTYIRALARDLGRALGVGGHLSALRRTRIGPFSVSAALSPEALDDTEALENHLTPPAAALGHIPAVEVGSAEAERIRHGQFLPLPSADLTEKTPVRVLLNGDLVAMAAMEDGHLKPRKVLFNG